MEKKVILTQLCDGFCIDIDDEHWHIDQEDDATEILEGMFKYLGYNVVIEGGF